MKNITLNQLKKEAWEKNAPVFLFTLFSTASIHLRERKFAKDLQLIINDLYQRFHEGEFDVPRFEYSHACSDYITDQFTLAFEKYFPDISDLSNENLLNEVVELYCGYDYDGAFTTLGFFRLRLLQKELKQRLRSIGFLP